VIALEDDDFRELAKLWPAIQKNLRASLMTVVKSRGYSRKRGPETEFGDSFPPVNLGGDEVPGRRIGTSHASIPGPQNGLQAPDPDFPAPAACDGSAPYVLARVSS